MYSATYCNYHCNVVFGNRTYMTSSHVRLESPRFILASTGECLKNFSSQETFLLYRKINKWLVILQIIYCSPYRKYVIYVLVHKKKKKYMEFLYRACTSLSCLRDFRESLIVTLDISKAFDGVWHKTLLAKLPAYSFTPSLCKLVSSFCLVAFYLLFTAQPRHPS